LYKVVPFVGQIGQKRNKLVKKEQAKCVACSLLCGIFEEREHGKGNKLVKKGTGYNPESEKKDTSYNRTCIKMKIFLAYVRIFVFLSGRFNLFLFTHGKEQAESEEEKKYKLKEKIQKRYKSEVIIQV